ncbi:unnamed protein product, partial [Symbiodinium necroappetens]
YAFRHGARKSNADVLEQYHTESIRALSAAKPGKKTVEQTQACNKHQSSLDSIREHEKSIMQVLNGGACAAKRRRSDFVKRLGVCDTEGKEILNALVNGGAIPPHLRNNESAQKLQRLSLYLRWVACNLLHDDYMKLKEKTSFDVVIVEKKAKDFMSHVREQSTQKVEIRHLPDACTLVGNCIPCALWHIAPLLRLTITSSIQNHELSENTEALKRRWRTYRSAAALYKTDLMCSVGLPADDVLSYILHYEGNGCPHCVAVQVLADRQNVMVLNGRTSMKLSMLAFREAFAAAVDRSTVVTYWQRRSRGELADKTGHLLDMQAGADISSDDEAANDEVCTARFSFDEDNKPVVSDNIQQTLRREVEETLLDLKA